MTNDTIRPRDLPAFTLLSEPFLLFHPERPQDAHRHPLQGLVQFGPYSRALLNRVTYPIRLAVIAPHGKTQAVRGLLAELERRHLPQERRQYLVEFLGFSRIFGVRLVAADQAACIELGPDTTAAINAAERPHLVLGDALTRAIGLLESVRDRFDVLMIYLPTEWQAGFLGTDDDFDLHDYVKALTATRLIPCQIIREDKAMAYPCRASVAWRLGIALYCKAGGIPWKLVNSAPQRAYVGLSYALRATDGDARFVTCCSQIFDADGGGLEFIAYETDDMHVDRDNPFLSRAEMRRVMARTLALYQRRHGGASPKEVVVHKSTEFKLEEVDGCLDAWSSVEPLQLIQVQEDVPWRGIRIDTPSGGSKGTPARYPIERGTALPIGPRELLLWTQGNAPTAVGGKDFFKEGKGIPAPLLLRRFAGHGPMFEAGQSVLDLTKMDWNNDALYDRLPVTLSYAGVLARTLKRMPKLVSMEHQFRYFM